MATAALVYEMEADKFPPKLSITIVEKRLRGWNLCGRTVAAYQCCTVFQSLHYSHLKMDTHVEHKKSRRELDEVAGWNTSEMEY
jgi:hypothetical protein